MEPALSKHLFTTDDNLGTSCVRMVNISDVLFSHTGYTPYEIRLYS